VDFGLQCPILGQNVRVAQPDINPKSKIQNLKLQGGAVGILVIGYGNTLRCDDGAGVALAEQLVAHWHRQCILAKLLTVTQLVPELAADIAADGVIAVVFVDAAAGGLGQPVQVRQVDSIVASPGLGHHLDPAALLVYTRLLYGCNLPAWLVTVPGADFDYGMDLSTEAQALLNRAPALADQVLTAIEEHVRCMS
jgi:hydrogenase maturation protease